MGACMISESLVALYYNTRWPSWVERLAHHAMACVTWFLMLSRGYGQGLALVLQAMEFTTLFVAARSFLDRAGMKKSKLYEVNGVAMILCWFLCRIVGYVYASIRLVAQWPSLKKADVHIIEKYIFVLCFVLGFALQVFWFTKMVRGAIKVFFPPRGQGCDEVPAHA